jgi:hypothetical protein
LSPAAHNGDAHAEKSREEKKRKLESHQVSAPTRCRFRP